MAPPASRPQPSGRPLRERLSALGRTIGAREAEHRERLEDAWREARRLHEVVSDALEGLHATFDDQGVTHLRVTLGPVRLDEKHIRAVQFELSRGRVVALVTVKSRGDVTLVGPFRAGKTEGPCESVAIADRVAVDEAVGAFLERFVDEATAP